MSVRGMGPMLGGLGASMVLLGLMNGVGGQLGIGVLLAGGGAVAVAGKSQWGSGRVAGGDAWLPAPAPVAADREARPVPSPRAVAAALSRAEVRQLSRSPALGAGIGLCLMIVLIFGVWWVDDNGGQLAENMELYPIFTHPLAGLLLLAAHRARTRSVRDGAEELFTACPTSQATRTVAHLRTAWVGAVIALVYLLAFTILLGTGTSGIWGPVGARQLALVLGSVLIAAGGVFLGVAVARWAPWQVAPVVAVVLVGIAAVNVATLGDTTSEPLRQLSLWLGDPEVDVRFTAPHWVAHHTWVLALTALVVVVALARDVRTPRLAAAGAGAVVLAVVAGVAATRPMDAGDARRIADLLARPELHQRCAAAGALPVCAYGGDEGLARHFAEEVAPVVAAVPAGALDGWTIRQGAGTRRLELDPAVVRHLPPQQPDGVIPAVMDYEPGADLGAREWVGLVAVGVEPPAYCHAPTILAGQARGVVALWLATRGASAEDALDMTRYDPVLEHGWNDPRPWPDASGPAPVVWGLSDVTAARQLLALPEADVAALVAAQWDRFTDPATTTDALLAAAGLDPVGRPTAMTREPEC